MIGVAKCNDVRTDVKLFGGIEESERIVRRVDAEYGIRHWHDWRKFGYGEIVQAQGSILPPRNDFLAFTWLQNVGVVVVGFVSNIADTNESIHEPRPLREDHGEEFCTSAIPQGITKGGGKTSETFALVEIDPNPYCGHGAVRRLDGVALTVEKKQPTLSLVVWEAEYDSREREIGWSRILTDN